MTAVNLQDLILENVHREMLIELGIGLVSVYNIDFNSNIAAMRFIDENTGWQFIARFIPTTSMYG